MRAWWLQFWPFPAPADTPVAPEGILSDAGRAMYWSGVSHGVLAVVIVAAVLALLWWLWRTDSPHVRAGIVASLLGALLWYAQAQQRHAAVPPVAPAPPAPDNPDPAKPKRPRPRGDEGSVLSCAA